MSNEAQNNETGADRCALDIVGLAMEALIDVPLTPGDRLREVATLAIFMHSHEADYRAAGVDDAEIEEGCRTMGRLAAGAVRMRFSAEV